MFDGDSWLANGRSMVKRGISWLANATVMENPGWLEEIHGKFFIWLAEQPKHRFCRVLGFGAAHWVMMRPKTLWSLED
jgi:hypothetical protein